MPIKHRFTGLLIVKKYKITPIISPMISNPLITLLLKYINADATPAIETIQNRASVTAAGIFILLLIAYNTSNNIPAANPVITIPNKAYTS